MVVIDRPLLIKLSCVLTFLIIALCSPKWDDSFLFTAWRKDPEMLFVGVLLLIGFICLLILFVLELTGSCFEEGFEGAVWHTFKVVLLSLAGMSLLSALVIRQITHTVLWSVFLTTCACTLVVDMGLLSVGNCPPIKI
ncbi:unnamed protein product [Calicophoron daubneyi]|uniref:Uncharacterized protein n=1 Tax=Calicophoron daubneyi TaxID=300641 RepID=A0AAV2SZZ6_CALDB